MDSLRIVAWKIGVVLGGLAVAWTFGLVFLGPLFVLLLLLGRVRIYGYWNLVYSVGRGGTLIVTNHPTLLDSFIIAMLLWPFYFVASRFFIWSMPDENYMERFLHIKWPWLAIAIFKTLRCVTVDRRIAGRSLYQRNNDALEAAAAKLDRNFSEINHPENGRTPSTKGDIQVFYHKGQVRRIRSSISSSAAKVAQKTRKRRVLTGYIDAPWATEPFSFWGCLWRLLAPWCKPVRIYFRNPRCTIQQPFNRAAERERMKLGILTS